MPAFCKIFTIYNLVFKFPLAIALISYILNCGYPCDPNGDLEWDTQSQHEVHPMATGSHDCWKRCRVYNLRLNLLMNRTRTNPTIDLFKIPIEKTPPNPFCFPPPLPLNEIDPLYKLKHFKAKKSRSHTVYRTMLVVVLITFLSIMFQVTMMMAADSEMVTAFYTLLSLTASTNLLAYYYGLKAQKFLACDYGVPVYNSNGSFVRFNSELFCGADVSVYHRGIGPTTVKLPNDNFFWFRMSLFLKIVNLFFMLLGGIDYYRRMRFAELRENRRRWALMQAAGL